MLCNKHVKDSQKPLQTKNGEISSKTQFLANSSFSRVGGKGGSLACSTLTYTTNVRKDNINKTKLIETYKENLEKFSKEEKRIYWENLREKFNVYWFLYPVEGRINYEGCLKKFQVLQKTMLPPREFYAYIRYCAYNRWDDIKPNYVPQMLKFLSAEDCRKMPEDEKKKARSYLIDEEKIQQIVAERKGGDK